MSELTAWSQLGAPACLQPAQRGLAAPHGPAELMSQKHWSPGHTEDQLREENELPRRNLQSRHQTITRGIAESCEEAAGKSLGPGFGVAQLCSTPSS